MHKNAIAVLLTGLLGVSTLTAGAQPGYPGPAGPAAGPYDEGYRRGYDDGRNRPPFGDRIRSGDYAYGRDADQRWRRYYQRPYTYRDDVYYRDCRTGVDPGGVIAGALIGGILGNALGRGGGRGGMTVAGVVLGGALGAALTRNMDCEDRSYAYNTYFQGLNSGRAGVPFQWRNPRNGHYGDFRIGDYYDDPGGFRCANFTQQIYIGDRPQAARGRACRQPDGTWAVVG
jgi:surface antigen